MILPTKLESGFTGDMALAIFEEFNADVEDELDKLACEVVATPFILAIEGSM